MRTAKLASLLALGFFLLSISAYARLGESKDEIYKRYGAVTRRTDIATNEWSGDYQFKEYRVRVYYKNNVSVGELVVPKEARSLSDSERDALMQSIGGEGKWQKKGDSHDTTMIAWENAKTKAMACVRIGISTRDALVIATPEWFDEMVATQKKDEADKTKGF